MSFFYQKMTKIDVVFSKCIISYFQKHFLLGEEQEADECCRAHDLCKPIIEPFITKYHHRNPSFFPISHCSCDVRLYNCFRRVNSTAANDIGRLFFNFARMHCFDFKVRLVCVEKWLGICWKMEAKCAAFVRENPWF